MSVSAKIAFGLCCTTSIGIIAYVHCQQAYDREQLHIGVVRDVERQQRRKIENLFILQKQMELAEELRRMEATSASQQNNT